MVLRWQVSKNPLSKLPLGNYRDHFLVFLPVPQLLHPLPLPLLQFLPRARFLLHLLPLPSRWSHPGFRHLQFSKGPSLTILVPVEGTSAFLPHRAHWHGILAAWITTSYS